MLNFKEHHQLNKEKMLRKLGVLEKVKIDMLMHFKQYIAF